MSRLGLLDGVAAELGVGAHDLPLLRGQLARFEQDVVGNAHLADVVQGAERLSRSM